MPPAGWSFYLLAFLNAALGMWLVWLAAAIVVDQRRRIAAVALLGLLPVFTFGVALFNQHVSAVALAVGRGDVPRVDRAPPCGVERPLWPRLGLAILGKYYAGLIVLACVLATLLHPER